MKTRLGFLALLLTTLVSSALALYNPGENDKEALSKVHGKRLTHPMHTEGFPRFRCSATAIWLKLVEAFETDDRICMSLPQQEVFMYQK